MVYKKNAKDHVKLFVSCFIIFGVSFGIFMGAFLGIQMALITENVLTGLIWFLLFLFLGGPFSGLLFGGLLTLSAAMSEKKTEKAAAANRAEFSKTNTVNCEGPATRVYDRKTLGGWLFLTDNTVDFIPHDTSNFKSVSISLGDIGKIEKRSNKLKISTNSGDSHTFIVEQAKLWVGSIAKIKSDKIA